MNTVEWQQRSFGYEAMVGDDLFRLVVFYEHGWKVGVNDRVIKHEYSDAETCKQVAVNWVREKLKIVESDLRQLENNVKAKCGLTQ